MSQVKCRVLVVEDHEDSAEMLRLILSVEHYEVTTAGAMKEAITLVARESFDLYVLDRRLPDGSGLELCQMLLEVTPDVPCIFYSGDAYELHRRQALEAGANAYIPKPDIDALIETCHNLLAERHCATATS